MAVVSVASLLPIPRTIKAVVALALSIYQHIAHHRIEFGPAFTANLEDAQGVVVHPVLIHAVEIGVGRQVRLHDFISHAFHLDVTCTVSQENADTQTNGRTGTFTLAKFTCLDLLELTTLLNIRKDGNIFVGVRRIQTSLGIGTFPGVLEPGL